MKPHVILHMASSIDGRIVVDGWPDALAPVDVYERIHGDLAGDGWIVGRVSMADMAEGAPQAVKASQSFSRTTWKAPDVPGGPYAIALDAGAKLHLNTGRVSGDPVILVLVEAVSDDYLAELRRDEISYIFAGGQEIDLSRALHILAEEFGITRLLLEGGGGINGSFLAAGLIDEFSLLIAPIADGMAGTPTTIDRTSGTPRPLRLIAVERLDRDLLHLRYAAA